MTSPTISTRAAATRSRHVEKRALTGGSTRRSSPADRHVFEAGAAHDVRLVQIATVEDQRLLHSPMQHLEVGAVKLLPFGDDDERIGAVAGVERIAGEREA